MSYNCRAEYLGDGRLRIKQADFDRLFEKYDEYQGLAECNFITERQVQPTEIAGELVITKLWSWLAELESRSVADFNASKAFPNHALTVQNRFADATRWHQTGCKSLFQAINYRANDPAISWTLRIIELDNN